MRWRRALLAIAVPIVSAAVVIGCCTADLITSSITPKSDFDAALIPKVPDYSRDEAWLALPNTKDEADVSLPESPAVDPPHARVDVFYVHPTSTVAPRWLSAHDDPDIRRASIRGGTLIQASAFNGSGVIYAPTYRQSSGMAYVTSTPSGERAIDVAYSDVRAAFDEFLKRTGTKRPFVLAGHSQGSMLLARLLREHIANAPEAQRMVAAYLMGGSLRAEDVAPFAACASRDEVGCVITFNARGPNHSRTGTEMGAQIQDPKRLCVHPVLGKTTDVLVPRAQHAGAVFFDSTHPALLKRFLSSACKNGKLVVTEMQPLPERDLASGILLWVMGGENFHPIEVQLFYADLRSDVAHRGSRFSSRSNAPRQ